MKIDGNCLCGHIRYEAVIDPSMVVLAGRTSQIRQRKNNAPV